MSADWISATDRVAELRHAFDCSFAEALSSEAAAPSDLLNVRLGTASYSLHIGELSGLFADITVTPLPSPVPELLGIAGFRGAILPVYDLRAMLGFTVEKTPRWVAIAAAMAVGLAFDEFEGHIRVPPEALVQHAGDAGAGHVREIVRLDTGNRPVVSVASILETIGNHVRAAAPEKE